MFGEPPNIESACNARLFIADNYGDNSSTMRCQLPPGHDGPHKEQFERDDDDGNNVVVITWTRDERKMCDHGCGRWDHEHHGSNDDSGCPKEAFAHEYSECALCHPGEEATTCAACGKAVYREESHARVACPKRPDAHKLTEEAFLAADSPDEFAEPSVEEKKS